MLTIATAAWFLFGSAWVWVSMKASEDQHVPPVPMWWSVWIGVVCVLLPATFGYAGHGTLWSVLLCLPLCGAALAAWPVALVYIRPHLDPPAPEPVDNVENWQQIAQREERRGEEFHRALHRTGEYLRREAPHVRGR